MRNRIFIPNYYDRRLDAKGALLAETLRVARKGDPIKTLRKSQRMFDNNFQKFVRIRIYYIFERSLARMVAQALLLFRR